jgi:hypothetical protein
MQTRTQFTTSSQGIISFGEVGPDNAFFLRLEPITMSLVDRSLACL